MSRLRLSLLGPLQAVVDGEPVSGLTSPKIQALLAYLAVERRAHPRGALAELLWPERPAGKAGQNLRKSLSRLKRALQGPGAPDFIQATRQTLALNPGVDVWVDVKAFTAAVAFARSHDHEAVEACPQCAGRLAEATGLYRGEFLQDLMAASAPFDEWATLQREWLHRQALEALGRVAAFHLARGDYRSGLQSARRQVELEPWLERGHRQLMRALAGMGRRSEALAAYEACQQTLAETLGVAPARETTALYEAIRDEEIGSRPQSAWSAPATRQPPLPSHNLPRQFTPFVGRQQEQEDVHRRLERETCALLTILGPGGVGKTRLAVEVAEQRQDRYRDGVWFVSLVAVANPSLVPVTIANQLNVPLAGTAAPADQLVDHLRSRHLLLVLDNVEQLVDGLDWLLDLLRAAPDVQLLLTSRVALNFRAEWLYEVAGLPYPPALTDAGSYPAPDLFVQLARRLEPAFTPEEEWEAIVRICQIVEGMPLALELAAAQLSGATCEQVAASIAGNVDRLATTMRDVPARQRSLRAVFSSSWDLLTAEEQAVLPRLSPFAGAFTADAARVVAGATPSLLQKLLDKSFLRLSAGDRYQMHEVLRHFAAEALGPERAAVSRRFVGYYADFAVAQRQLLDGERQQEGLASMTRAFDNLMAAWRLALEQADVAQDEAVLHPFGDALWAYLDDRGLYRDGLDLFERALAAAPPEPNTQASARVWTYLRLATGFFHQRLGEYPQARRHYEHCLEVYQGLGDLEQSAHCLYYLGSIASNGGQQEEAAKRLREALAICQRLESERHVASTLTKLGSVLELMGRFEEAEQMLQEALALKRALGQPLAIAHSLNNLGLVLWHMGHLDEAEARFREALALNRQVDNPGNAVFCLNNLGRMAITRGEYRRAEALLQESLALQQQVQSKRQMAFVFNSLGLVSHLRGGGEQAHAYLAQALALARETGNRREATSARLTLARILLDEGAVEEAAGLLRSGLQGAAELRLTSLALSALVQAARLQLTRGERARAAALLQLSMRHPAAWWETRVEAREMAAERGLEADPEAATPDLRQAIADLLDTL